MTLKYGSNEVNIAPSTQSISVSNLNPLCGRNRYLLSESVVCGWLLYDKKLVVLDGALISSSLGFDWDTTSNRLNNISCSLLLYSHRIQSQEDYTPIKVICRVPHGTWASSNPTWVTGSKNTILHT